MTLVIKGSVICKHACLASSPGPSQFFNVTRRKIYVEKIGEPGDEAMHADVVVEQDNKIHLDNNPVNIALW